jgi:hypothetical protein
MNVSLLMFTMGEKCPFLLGTDNIRVFSNNFRDCPLFAVGSSRKICLSARCASAAIIE